MISQYLIDRLKEKGYCIVSQADDEVIVKGTFTSTSKTEWPVNEDMPLYSDREIRKFLEIHG